jgi:hypothetical protein
MAPRYSESRRRRVVTLLNAIADLRHGDLHAVLELDRYTPLSDGLNDGMRTGEALSWLLEDHLSHVLGFGEVGLDPDIRPRTGKEIGGRRFS